MSGSLTPILQITQVAQNQNQKEVTINDGFLAIENATQAGSDINLSTGTVTLTPLQFAQSFAFICSGNTANAVLTVPLIERFFYVENKGSAFPIAVGGTTGSSVSIPPLSSGLLYCDGTNVASPIALAAGEVVQSVNGETGAVTGLEEIANKGTAGGYAGLDSTGRVPLAQLPANLGSINAIATQAVPSAGLVYSNGSILADVTLGANIAFSAGTLSATGGGSASSEWNAGTVSALGSGLSLAGGTLEATGGGSGGGSSEWSAGTITAIGNGLSVAVILPPYQYWRILCPNFTGIAELEFHSTVGGPNILTPSNIIVDSIYNSDYPATAMLDGNLSTSWGGAGAPAWCGCNLGSSGATDVVEIVITARNDSYYYEAPSSFQLQYSNDGVSWATVQTFTTTWTDPSQKQTFDVSPGAASAIETSALVAQWSAGNVSALGSGLSLAPNGTLSANVALAALTAAIASLGTTHPGGTGTLWLNGGNLALS